jgi:zinc D-Ala-D-Ala carboxypeptidase
MARHWLVVTIAATALGVGCVAALDLGPGPATATVPPPPPSTTTAPPQALDPGLVRAFDAAATAAAAQSHRLTITSGFRTAAEQQALLDAEIEERGSVEEALRWVFTPERSMHVRGLAVDVGDGPAADWLDAEGARFGLCRTLAWEWWHFEWRASWEREQWCPGPVDDPADAPT